jgi:enoyl-CoA hydratase / long-chain 3-hydroxyacyl-CoA dehydrogenase
MRRCVLLHRRPGTAGPRFASSALPALGPRFASSALPALGPRFASSALPALDPRSGVHTSRTPSGVLLIRLDSPGEKVNVLSAEMMTAFSSVLSTLQSDHTVKAAVVLSAKPDNFIAGADVKMFDECATAADLSRLSSHGQRVMDAVAAARVPIVAAIHGACLGGGLELALACTYRVASSSPKTRLGLPEVQLGLLPGAGGTQRLPRTVGIQAALSLMTTGSSIRADRARRMGLVEEVVDPAALEAVAVEAALELASGTLKARPKSSRQPGLQPGLLAWLLEGNPLGRRVLFDRARAQVAKATGGHYPAPAAIVDTVEEGVTHGVAAGLAREAREFGNLGFSDESRALRGIFFAQRETKKNPYGLVPADLQVRNVAVLGAGLMGAGIAHVTSLVAGLPVTLKDRTREAVLRGEAQVADELAAGVRKKRLTPFESAVAASRITGVSDGDASWERHVGRADLVIEAVFEDLAAKHDVLRRIEPLLRPTAVVATNTSAIPIAKIAAGSRRPDRVVGMHYFSPVPKMPLLEVIPHAGTANDAAAIAVDTGYRQGKTVIVVKDVPGFFVNRCLSPYMAEAFALVQSGVDPVALDAAIKAWGFPVGPLTLVDEVGVDVAFHTYRTLLGSLGVRMAGWNPQGLQEVVNRKWLGRKSGKGFYIYPSSSTGKGKGKAGAGAAGPRPIHQEMIDLLRTYPSSASPSLSPAVLQERMVLRFVKECIHSLDDGIIRSAADGDIGAVFGLGFPPFRGGPFRWCDSVGAAVVVDKMRGYARTVGPQFEPPASLVAMAGDGRTFHGGVAARKG